MLDLSSTPDEFLQPIACVVEAALRHADSLRSEDVMVVGAWCRDIQHHALGHRFATSATRDLDLALALSSWDAYRALADAFPWVGDTGIRFRIAEVTVDLLPFGEIEDPQGTAQPPTRGEKLSVWAFEEIFAASLSFVLPAVGTVRIPTVAGYAAAKLGGWLDRSEWFEAKDAADLALVLYWYGESGAVHERLYATSAGNEILIAESADVPRAAARMLGVDVATTIGSDRLAELLARWPGNLNLLIHELSVASDAAWPRDGKRRSDLVDTLTRGMTESPPDSASNPRGGDG
jgi:predicted nucleotidyltransferase